MSQYKGVKTRVMVDSGLSEEFEAKVGMHQGSVLSPLLIAVVADAVTEYAREGAQCELLYADDLDLLSETTKGLRNKLLKWKAAFGSKGLKVNLWKTKAIVRGNITMDGLPKSKVDPCGVCSLRIKDNSVLCAHCGKWFHCRCAGVKKVTPKI